MSTARVDYALGILEARSLGRPNDLGFEDPAGIVRAELQRLREQVRVAIGRLRDVEKVNVSECLRGLEG